MDIDELLIILEKNRTKLTKIDDDFYDRIKDEIRKLEKMRDRADDEEISRINDNIRTLRRILKKIFETRTSKIIRIAWSMVCGNSESTENLNSGEKELLFRLVEVIKNYKERIMSYPEKDVHYEQVREEKIEKIENDYVLVRVKTSIDEFEGVDGKTYKLSREDVVTLPRLNAKALIKADIVEIIESDEVKI
ncbi:Uncharacterized protein conserved in archaea [Archaeoglobus sulfaticallidus PM70-1]|uniref:Uncharacterized protein conserved in archaea n=1 Tax=Archaeoglobus sulfaticallidus PM70-1 TaxID=387631 RepID=N0BDJ4_9EURY|nr:hypothetical protein [Archaeoglobus sulfaticallidus]AGK60322.1 Uncharacterized protein conserved in archaea [Archaeoglobus sulfaticallidus PM70-1]